ncbi:MAG: hypothetical protein ACPLRW_07380 [Moorellales bacterium]
MTRGVVRFCLIWFLLSRAVFLVPAYTVFYSSPKPPAPPGYVEGFQGPLDRRPLNVLFYYDATHYLRIAREGYSRDESPWYPLYPLLIRVLGGTAASAVAVSNAAFFLGLLGLYRLGGGRAVVLASVSPLGIVFSSAYSESLFFCLAIWALALGGRPVLRGVLCGLAALSRPPGLALVLLSLADLLRRRSPADVAASVLALAGAAAFPLYLWERFGTPFVGAEVNAAIASRSLEPFWWGPTRDIWRVLSGGFPADRVPHVAFNLLLGLGWICFGAAGPGRVAAAAYAAAVLSFPVHWIAPWPPATHGLLRYACAWPGSYLGLARLLRSRAAFAAAAAGSACAGAVVAVVVACKGFLF